MTNAARLFLTSLKDKECTLSGALVEYPQPPALATKRLEDRRFSITKPTRPANLRRKPNPTETKETSDDQSPRFY